MSSIEQTHANMSGTLEAFIQLEKDIVYEDYANPSNVRSAVENAEAALVFVQYYVERY